MVGHGSLTSMNDNGNFSASNPERAVQRSDSPEYLEVSTGELAIFGDKRGFCLGYVGRMWLS